MPSFGTVDYLVLGLTIPGTVFAFLVLCAFAYVAWNPISRVHMNRVSLRLLVYALVATCIFGAAYCMGTEFGRHPSPQCDFSVFLMNISLLFSCNMFFCMALNLQLVLVHHVQWKNLELCYMIGSFLLCAACTIPPYAAEQFGWSEAMQSCWYRTSSDATMLRWVIGTQSFWTLFMVTGELIVFFVIMGYLISYALTIRRYRRKPTGANSLDGIIPEPKSPIVKYRNLIIRIGLYPLASCLMNLSTVALDLIVAKSTAGEHPAQLLEMVDLVLYACRPLIYSLIAATDPSFLRAVSALRRAGRESSVEQAQNITFQAHSPPGASISSSSSTMPELSTQDDLRSKEILEISLPGTRQSSSAATDDEDKDIPAHL